MFSPIETSRLILRPWRSGDLPALADMNADAQVMAYFPSVLTARESRELFERAQRRIQSDGFCFAPVEHKQSGAFLGFAGLHRPVFKPALAFEPCVEIGWRLVRSAWGQGYATEAARAWLRFGFETLELREIVSFTSTDNSRSRAVMQRLGMRHDKDCDFDHPGIADGHTLKRHVLYRLSELDWRRDAAVA